MPGTLWGLQCKAEPCGCTASAWGLPASYHVTGDPRERWPRERDFRDWLMASPGVLAECLGMPGIEFTGRTVVIGDQVAGFDRLGRQRWNGGLRADLTARDAQGRAIVIEAQLGSADHDHLGSRVLLALVRSRALPL